MENEKVSSIIWVFLAILIIFAGSICYYLFKSRVDYKLNKTEYRLTYVVYYPDLIDTITVSNNTGYYWFSDRGTNRIKERGTNSEVFGGTNIIRILSYKSEFINKKQN